MRALMLWLLLSVTAYAAPQDAICRVRVPSGNGASLGSGALVEWEGNRYVITNWHVVNERTANDNVTVSWPADGNQPRQAIVLMTDHSTDADLAVLAVSGDTSQLEALPIAETDAEQSAYVGGFGGDNTLRVVQAPLGTIGPWHRLGQPVRSGDSGGPVFTARGFYIGAVWGSGGGLPNESVAVRIAPVRRLLASVARGIRTATLPAQYRQCPPGVTCPWNQPQQPTRPVQPQQPLAPVERQPDCCDELEAKLEALSGKFTGLDSKVDKLAKLTGDLATKSGEGFDKINARFVAIETRIEGLKCPDYSPQFKGINERLDALEGRIDSKPADPFPVYYTLVADQGAEYWPRLKDEYARASQAFQGVRVVAPPSNGVGLLPRLVAFRLGTPIGNVGGDRAVSEALRSLSQGQSPAFY